MRLVAITVKFHSLMILHLPSGTHLAHQARAKCFSLFCFCDTPKTGIDPLLEVKPTALRQADAAI